MHSVERHIVDVVVLTMMALRAVYSVELSQWIILAAPHPFVNVHHLEYSVPLRMLWSVHSPSFVLLGLVLSFLSFRQRVLATTCFDSVHLVGTAGFAAEQ